jgi:hypothetical protein
MRLAFLAPSIIEEGARSDQPPELTAQALSTRSGELSPVPLRCAKRAYGNSAFLRPIQALDERKARETLRFLREFSTVRNQGILIW